MPEIKNLKKAAQRIIAAIKNKEKIVLYGDADLDGVSSVIILENTIKNLGGKVSALYFPDREIEGYGITEKGLSFLEKKAPALLVAMDCGIGNFKEVKLAKKLGFKVIIVDHHEILEELPEAEIVVDPKQPGDKYPFKFLATVGIAFKLSKALLEDKMTDSVRKNFLELVALATLADMMPQTSENRIMTTEGLTFLKSSWRPGLQALFELKVIRSLDFNHRISKINSLLNIRDIENKMPAAFRILTASNKNKAKELAEKLYQKGLERKEKIYKMIAEIEERLVKKEAEQIIFEGDSSWEEAFLGIAASTVSQRHQKPTFLYKKLEKESQGGIRAPSGYNVVEMMKGCSKYLITFGGHPQAAGFRLKNENLDKFRNCLINQL
ncbi:MAG: DHH family phosphoesterase [Candidatus Pacebacteria bacterium]|nr:DHH family phosphoesterase [Candidatus Paceibacterota bacterium]